MTLPVRRERPRPRKAASGSLPPSRVPGEGLRAGSGEAPTTLEGGGLGNGALAFYLQRTGQRWDRVPQPREGQARLSPESSALLAPSTCWLEAAPGDGGHVAAGWLLGGSSGLGPRRYTCEEDRVDPEDAMTLQGQQRLESSRQVVGVTVCATHLGTSGSWEHGGRSGGGAPHLVERGHL